MRRTELTSRSQSARRTFSSKLVSAVVSSPTDPFGSTALSRHLGLFDFVGESIERGGEVDFVRVKEVALGISRDSRE